ncbi:hypothetical protein LIER_03103 [Lithospermum erythrorhizon]|uniref:Uncharacterized protein n=1 Tax=Lithospermum erythrorhizon TaxID=34254 RepID=A0AAV3NRY8_LITER
MDAISSSSSRSSRGDESPLPDSHIIEMTNTDGSPNLDMMLVYMETIKDEIRLLERNHDELQSAHQKRKK